LRVRTRVRGRFQSTMTGGEDGREGLTRPSTKTGPSEAACLLGLLARCTLFEPLAEVGQLCPEGGIAEPPFRTREVAKGLRVRMDGFP
jgi:hypothetical protein